MIAQARTKLTALVLIALLALIMALLFFWLDSRREEALADGRRMRERGTHVHELLEALLDAETTQRGYLLTGEDHYLTACREALAEVQERCVHVEAMVEGEERAHFRSLVETQLTELADVAALAEQGRSAEAIAQVSAHRSPMGELRALLDRLFQEAEAGRLEAQTRRRELAQAAQVGMVLALTLLSSLVLLVFFGIRRDLAQSDAQQRLIQEQARELAVKSEGLERVASSLEEQNEALAKANRDLDVAARARQRVLADLERRNQDLDQFAYVTSHDLKAPLRAISNLTTWIEEELPAGTTAETRENLALLRRRAARMEMLIEGILAYSRAGRGRGTPTEVRSMAEVAEEVRALLGVDSGLWDVACGEARCPPQHTEVVQVLSNIASNAIEHGGPGKPIHLRAEENDGVLHVSIRDEGPGIDPRYHERIFEIFQTLAPRDQLESAGIGLAIVKKLVTGAGGRVWVESSAGAGATFHFTWPLSESEEP